MPQPFILDSLKQFQENEQFAVEVLSRAAKNNHFSHAYIFTGRNRENTFNFVTSFAKLLLCNSLNAVDNCQSCRVFDDQQHPDFRVWGPESEKSSSIKIEQVRELIAANQRHPVTSSHKVLVLLQADRLTVPGSNALLKTLEEPNNFTKLILTVGSVDKLLSTIISRCQIIPLNTPDSKSSQVEFELSQYLPESYNHARKIAGEIIKLDKKELMEFVINLQARLWLNYKQDNSFQSNLQAVTELLNKIEEYIKALESYVNPKLVVDNLFIDLYENNDLFNIKREPE